MILSLKAINHFGAKPSCTILIHLREVFKQKWWRVAEYGAFTVTHSIIVEKLGAKIFYSDKEFNILAWLLKVGTVIA